MEVLYGKQDLAEVHSCAVLFKTLVFVKSSTHITAGGIVEEHEELFGSLECKPEADNEGVARVREHISLCLGVLHQILTHDLFLVQYFHCVLVPSGYGSPVLLEVQLLDQVDLAERALTQFVYNLEVAGTDRIFLPVLQHFVLLLRSLLLLMGLSELELDKLLLPSFVQLLGRLLLLGLLGLLFLRSLLCCYLLAFALLVVHQLVDILRL
mmetsp:Transcript_19331/g.32916  ORF Transcript_19331/g.32916 Transcript_19331/m.32916 type:complete len:210 (+) Transcript_19331:671-1300(+)